MTRKATFCGKCDMWFDYNADLENGYYCPVCRVQRGLPIYRDGMNVQYIESEDALLWQPKDIREHLMALKINATKYERAPVAVRRQYQEQGENFSDPERRKAANANLMRAAI